MSKKFKVLSLLLLVSGIVYHNTLQSSHSQEIVMLPALPGHKHGIHVGGTYLHRNGHRYKVLTVARNTEDLSWSVVYEALYENEVSQIWCRKLEDFLAVITLEDGTQQPRFIYQANE